MKWFVFTLLAAHVARCLFALISSDETEIQRIASLIVIAIYAFAALWVFQR